MSVRTKTFSQFLFPFALFLIVANAALAANGINLYTPFTQISVPPGESIDYSVDVINNGSSIKDVSLSVSGIPDGWTYSMKSGGWTIKQVSVLPKEKKTVNFKVNVPFNADKGDYKFSVVAKNYDNLPLVINISEKGTFKTEFTTDQANMQGHAKSNFSFSAELKNDTGVKQLYSLRSNTPRGWNVIFKPRSKQATSVEILPNDNARISIEVKPPHNVSAGTYTIPVRAITNSSAAELKLEVVITGSFELQLTTPTGLLSSTVTAGSQKRVELMVRNSGSSPLNNILFSSTKPKNWDVTFKPDTVVVLEPGATAKVFATIEADDKAIPGDYVAKMAARTPEANANAAFRISVKTPLIWGWLGILVIVAALGGVYYLFQKYGRR